MSRQLTDLETLLRLMIAEHGKLLEQIDVQHLAMRAMRAAEMEELVGRQETTRLRIATLDSKRRAIALQLGRLMRVEGEPTIAQLAKAFPQRSADLLKLRTELRDLVMQIDAKTTIASRLAGAVLGHLNTAVRLIAGAVEQAGVYTKNGTPKVAARIGAIEAVG